MRKILSKTACKPHTRWCTAPLLPILYRHIFSIIIPPLQLANNFKTTSSSIIQLIQLPYPGQNIFVMANGCHSCSFIRIAWRHLCPVIHVWVHETISYLQTLTSTHSFNILTSLHVTQNLNICSFMSIIRHNIVNKHCTLLLKWLPHTTFLLARSTWLEAQIKSQALWSQVPIGYTEGRRFRSVFADH